ncbi:MAG: nitroreductase family protein, partial [Myxococcales bacterium]|nr:nitroreductase family protein [Myxococcales bacterium]
MRRIGWSIVAAIALGILHGTEVARTQPAERALPRPTSSDGPGVWTVIASRRSERTFGARSLSEQELGQLLWAAQGMLDGHRTVPSAGALYPLRVQLVDARGSWRYEPGRHALVSEGSGDRRADLSAAAWRQSS